ncbi:MAG: dienelactone hydrolase family protein [Ilumatobacteraceae bacterium]
MVLDQNARITQPDGVVTEGDLVVPDDPGGTIVFAHGSGSGRHSPRNRAVAQSLQGSGFATLLLDLLTADEEQLDRTRGHLRFDIELLARRLDTAAAWVQARRELVGVPIGYFGASTGAAAALIAAAEHPDRVGAIVSRGGRADLAGDRLRRVACPTLLIVGEADEVVLDLNRRALRQVTAGSSLEVVPGATHLFEEPGALDVVTELATHWFVTHLARRSFERPA